MIQDLTAQTIEIVGDGGTPIEAYRANPSDEGKRGGVVIIHHLPGYDPGTKEIARRFAAMGYDAVVPNLYSRLAPPGADWEAVAAQAREQGGVEDSQLIGDVAGAGSYLRGLGSSNGKVGVIGYCSGGRQSVLVGCHLDVDAVVDCYGAFVIGNPPPGFPLQRNGLEDQLPHLRCPLLGLFGNEDTHPAPEQVDELDRRLTELGKDHEIHRYDDAGHAFFSVDRPAYRVAAATDGWRRIDDFYSRHLS
jgi:carboxymethylenebutenolidase